MPGREGAEPQERRTGAGRLVRAFLADRPPGDRSGAHDFLVSANDLRRFGPPPFDRDAPGGRPDDRAVRGHRDLRGARGSGAYLERGARPTRERVLTAASHGAPRRHFFP